MHLSQNRISSLIGLVYLCIAVPGYSFPDDDLFAGAKEGNYRKVNQAIVKGANIHAVRGPWSWSALHMAAGHSNTRRIMQRLQNSGLNIDVVDSGNWTPLHVAAFYGRVGSVRQLLLLGADRWRVNNEGLTPLQIARARGYRRVAALLEQTDRVVDRREVTRESEIDRRIRLEFPWAIGNWFAPLLLLNGKMSL